ncbi:MAG: phenylalanine--tRNA ligase subunit beta [Caldisphaeraceae archaeon]|nr:phenylalanine--tRNA ligase subunit beta [Caldisphaeraceae archaeon]
MPVLRFNAERLMELTGLEINPLMDALFSLKCETSLNEDNELEVEVNPDRPDMYISYGISRAVKGIMNFEIGYKGVEASSSSISLRSDSPSTRPYIALATIYNVKLDEITIKELIQFQEKLHDGIGRKRRKVAIGIHDLDKVPTKDLLYTYESLDKEFTPLGYKRMSIRDALKETGQGVKYGEISVKNNLHPAIVSGGEIISLPPVINSDITRLDENTRNLLIDVTGTDAYYVNKVVDIIVSNLYEAKGVSIGKVKIIKDDKGEETPKLEEKTISVSAKYINSILGTNLSPVEINYHLLKARLNATVNNDAIVVRVPPYRVDIMGGVDIAEEVAISIGYNDMILRKPKEMMKGGLLEMSKLKRRIKDLMIGLGFTELMSLTLASKHEMEKLGLKGLITISNPIQEDYNSLRPSLIISMIKAMSKNRGVEKPVRLFEIGRVVSFNGEVKENENLAISIMDESLSYEDIQAVVYSLLRVLGIDFSINEGGKIYLLKGRSSIIKIKENEAGFMGEVDPRLLLKFNIDYPMVYAELSLGEMIGSTG